MIVAAVTCEPAVPVLESVRKLPAAAPQVNVMPALVVRKSLDLNDAAVTATCAEFVEVPKTPKTNPAIATDATRVTATMSTVATIGEMALLPRLRNVDIIIEIRVSAAILTVVEFRYGPRIHPLD